MSGWEEARQLPLADFDDAAVAVVARETESAYIITRNVDDFARSPVPAITPADFLSSSLKKDATAKRSVSTALLISADLNHVENRFVW